MKVKSVLILLVSVLFSALSVNGADLLMWDLSKESKDWNAVGVKEKTVDSDGVRFLSEKDCQIYLAGPAFQAGDFVVLEVVMKSDTDSKGQVFFGTDIKGLSEKASIRFPVKASSDYQTCKIDMSSNPAWSGTVGCFRLDPVEPAGIRVELKSVTLKPAFFWDFNALSMLSGWTSFDAAELTYTADSLSFICGKDPTLTSPDIKIDASKYNALEVVMKSDKDDGLQVFFAATRKEFNEKGSVRMPVKASSDFQTYTVKLNSNALWTGTIGVLRVDPVNKAGTNIHIKSIRLVNLK